MAGGKLAFKRIAKGFQKYGVEMVVGGSVGFSELL
jgi:hypothetical protein